MYISSSNLKVMIWKNNKTHVFKNMYKTQTQDNFYDGDGKTQTLAAVEPCSQHMGYTNNGGGGISDSYSVTWKICRKIYIFCFHMLQPIILNSCTIQSSEASKTNHPIFFSSDSKYFEKECCTFQIVSFFLFQEYTNIF